MLEGLDLSVALFKRLGTWFTNTIQYQGQSDKSEIPIAFAARASDCRFLFGRLVFQQNRHDSYIHGMARR
jgi:hypothetical protein